MEKMTSKMDKSVNFVEEQLQGFIEARYVRRSDDYFNCYLSSQSGCNKGCRFCHLTATKQTTFVDVDMYGFLDQAQQVFKHYKREKPAKYVHYSFMARGEILSNQHILDGADRLLFTLGELATQNGLIPKFNISTIIPKNLDRSLSDIFKIITPTIYYSLYSADEDFRKEWMPMAMPSEKAMRLLKDYQTVSKKIVKIHFPFIKGQNDSAKDMIKIRDLIKSVDLACEYNLVRYNPFSPEQGEESDAETLKYNFEFMQEHVLRAKEIQRVGFDVKASCGMFVEGEK